MYDITKARVMGLIEQCAYLNRQMRATLFHTRYIEGSESNWIALVSLGFSIHGISTAIADDARVATRAAATGQSLRRHAGQCRADHVQILGLSLGKLVSLDGQLCKVVCKKRFS